jgi:hypothetical protein
MKNRIVRAPAALLALCVAILGPALLAAPAGAETQHRTQVERNSERVMPFSMADAMHHFDPTPTGGVQRVLVHDGDAKQIALVRAHLRKEAAAFARGDFADPATIHGPTMPGLQALHAGAKRIVVRYADVPNGAKIVYATTDPQLVGAIHAWFKAQVDDHGSHATMKM